MVQLDKFTFRTSGCIVSDSTQNPPTIGPMRRVDHKAMLDRWFIHQDPDDDPMYIECAVSSDPKQFCMFMLIHPEHNPISQGLAALLRQLISWIPEPDGIDPFVLAHPDFDIQNFIVSEEGELLGLIDWDGVATVPRSLGNERYPGWLTCEWDPAMYGYKGSMEHGDEAEGVWENSPQCLALYRSIYDGIMARYRVVRIPGFETNICRMSLVAENLAIAADNSPRRNVILRKIVEEIWATAGEGEEADFMDLANMFVEYKVDVLLMERLEKGFHILLSKEGLYIGCVAEIDAVHI